METLYRRELNHSYLVLKTDTPHSFTDYCTKMLLCNPIDGLLPCNLRTIDGESFLYYEITSHQSLYQIYENKKIIQIQQVFQRLCNSQHPYYSWRNNGIFYKGNKFWS